MVERDVVLAKIASVERCLRRIDQVTRGDPSRLDDRDAEDIFVLNLQRAVQSAIDLAHHLVAAKALGLPATLKEAFALLERGAGLRPELARHMAAMVGFRNIAVHDYQALDPLVLKAILTKHLPDLQAFCRFALDQLV